MKLTHSSDPAQVADKVELVGQSDPKVLAEGGEIQLSLAPVRRLEPRTPEDLARAAEQVAPFVWLAKEEKYLPSDASLFVTHSELLFAYDSPCPAKSLVLHPNETDLAAGTYQAYGVKSSQDSPTDVPDPDPCVPDEDVVYKTNEGKPASLTTGQGFYLDLADDQRAGIGIKAPVYWQYVDNQDGTGEFVFWLFYAYNEFFNNHEADWERVAVRFDWTGGSGPSATGIVFWKHNEGPCFEAKDQLETLGGRLISYAAEGSHGSYPRADKFVIKKKIAEDNTSRGQLWETNKNLRPVENELWWGYRGLWGKAVGVPGFTGIAGPNPDRNSTVAKEAKSLKSC